jgi:MFS family permease
MAGLLRPGSVHQPDVGLSEPGAPSYRALFAVPGLGRAVVSALFARTAATMQLVVVVLFVLARFHSPALAGVTVMMASLPGLFVSPLAGALLDRVARIPLMALDYSIGGSGLVVLCGLALAGALPRWALLVTVGAAALSTPLSSTGMRALFPTLVPRVLWDRANAIDSGGYVVAAVMGPGLAGLSVALLGSTVGLLVPAGLLMGAALLLTGVRLPATPRTDRTPILTDAARAVGYVWRHPTLRMLAVTISIMNLSWGAENVGLPVLVLHRLHGGATTVGLLFAISGVSGIVAALVVGRIGSEGRERLMLTAGCLISVPMMAGLAVLRSEWQLALCMVVGGLASGPIDVGIFSLRQRVTDPQWFGRAFAVSMSLNMLGLPIGAAVAGPLLARSTRAPFLAAAAIVLVSALLPHLMGDRRAPAVVVTAGAAN